MNRIVSGLLLNLIREYDSRGADLNQSIILTSTAIKELLSVLPTQMTTSSDSQVVLHINDYHITIIERNYALDADAIHKIMTATSHRIYPDLSYEENQKRLSQK